MKNLLSLLNHIENNDLKYNIINEYSQLRIEILSDTKRKKDHGGNGFVNWLTIDEDDKIFLGVDDSCGYVKVDLKTLLDYISRID